jgi:hypothetical protein
MNSLNDPVKILARRFASLPPQIRMKVAVKLLGSGDEKQEGHGPCGRRKSFLERFWDEVEAGHDDGLYPMNPFATPQLMLYGAGSRPEQHLVHLSC